MVAEIDAHCHFWRLSRGDYGWLDGSGGPLAPIRHDFLPADYPGLNDSGHNHPGRVIAVQAAPTLAETDFLLSLAAQEPRIAGVVGWVDLADTASVQALTARAAAGPLRAVRPMLQDIADTDWLLTAPDPAVLATLTGLGMGMDALVTARHLPMLDRFAAQNPDLPIVIDHAAKPQPDRDAGRGADWADGMRRLAARPGVWCKLSGLMTELSPRQRQDPLPALRKIFTQLLDWFGPSRLIWGSDWPVLTLAATLPEWRSLSAALTADLSDAERAAIFGGNAARFYGVAG